MTKVKLDLKNLSDLEVIQLATTLKTNMTGNANFATPTPPLATIGTNITAGQTAKTISDTANTVAKQRTNEKNTAIDLIKANITQLAAYAVATVNGDPAKLQSAGFTIAAGSQGATAMTQVLNLAATCADSDGEVDLQWDPLKNAHSYETQYTETPDDEVSWGHSSNSSQSKTVLLGLPSGTKLWFRVRALGGNNNAGPWSDPCTKRVP